MKFDIKKTLQVRSDRVKGIDFHPTEPWILTTLFSGRVQIYSYETQAVIKTIEVSDLPVRAGRFIARKNWIVVGSDDYQIRVFNYNTSEKVFQFEAHPDYIRTIAIHPTQPIILSAGDDMTIKMWNWEMNWKLLRTFESHTHYVMYVAFNPKDPNTFASACLDGTVKIWSLGSSTPNLTFLAHETRGVNFVEYYPHPDKPYLITSSDDKTIRVWDYQMKSNVATLEGHTSNVSFAIFHPELPIIISGSEDRSVSIWNSNTFKLEQTLNYGLSRAWCVTCRKGSNYVGLGFDGGVVVLQMGKDEPTISMDPTGKIVWSKHSEVFSSVVKHSEELKDGDLLTLAQKDLGSVEVFPTQLIHSPNGRFVAVTGDGEYIIYTALAWRNKSFGSAVDFVWAQDNNEYAVRNSNNQVQLFKNFKERSDALNVPFKPTKLFGGSLIGCKSDDFVSFYDWETGRLVRRVDVDAQQVFWSEAGDLVAITSEDTFYVLKYDRDLFLESLNNGTYEDDSGAEDSFDLIYDISESVRTGKWVGDCFLYTTTSNKLNYLVGGEAYTISHFDKQMYLLGYIPRDNAVYLADKDVNVTSYHFSLKVLEYQTLILRGDMDLASEVLEDIPETEKTKVARFLEAQGYPEIALEVSEDPEQRFDLAITLGNLKIAQKIAADVNNSHKWKLLGDAALKSWNVTLAEECFKQANDLESLLLIYTSTGNNVALKDVAMQATDLGKYNVAFNALWYVQDIDKCVKLLNKTNRSPEAALLALSYGGDISKSVDLWKKQLVASGKQKTAAVIISPEDSPDKFPTSQVQSLGNGSNEGDLIDINEAVTEPESSNVTEENSVSQQVISEE
ncbi:uncharacterized protein SAPINGB_P004793 [Magnusiomyces paraingens]|uniref:Coatomer subunit beta' n=1 Tax=Magnusiomyces paraingens TaxID=2606893 RepID=A0A5E8BYF1_9ASCO|nr:uncharacterized protein SAPINGB_P004793 [Saprochaete ingens]VVT56082.1 unnamed protein product [Saprochaete ingens]